MLNSIKCTILKQNLDKEEKTNPLLFSCQGDLQKKIFFHKWPYRIMDDDHFWFGRQWVCSAAEGPESVEDRPVSGGSSVDYFYLCVIKFLDNIQHQVMILLSNHNDNSSDPW